MQSLPERRLTAAFDAILAFARLSDDFNPLHVDRDFAAGTAFGGVIAHGPMSTGLLLTALEQGLPPEALTGATLRLRLRRPVREDDTVTAGGSPDEEGALQVWVRNQAGEPVIEGTFAPGVKP